MSHALAEVTTTIVKTFADFNIPMEVTKTFEGFSYYHIHLVPTVPVRMHEVQGFVDDLRFALGRYVVKIEAPVRQKKEIAIRVIKDSLAETVPWTTLHTQLTQETDASPLLVPLGMTEEREIKFMDLAVVRHLIVGGRTLAGKSNFLHGVINSLILRHGPDTLQLMLVDPTSVSFARYHNLPHLLTTPITQSDKTLLALRWLRKEMDRRYDILEATGCDEITTYRAVLDAPLYVEEPMPYIVLVIDEFADLMFNSGDEAEALLSSLAIYGRAVGIHFILATSSTEPSVLRSMLLGYIGAGLSFSVQTKEASEALVYVPDAEDLIARGSAILTAPDDFVPLQLQTGLISDDEIWANILDVKRRYGAVDENNVDLTMLPDFQIRSCVFDEDDELYEEAKQAVLTDRKASTSYLQRKFRIGYSRAARLIDLLEERGVIGPADGSRPREILE